MTLDDAGFDLIFRKARTANTYLDTPVTEADLKAIWDLMKWGPTSANSHPVRILWLLSQEAKDKLAAHAGGANPSKIRAAPAAAIVGMDMEFHERLPRLFPHTDARSWFAGNDELIAKTAFRNASLQGAYLIIAARSLGFDVGPMSGFDNAAVDEAFFAGTTIKSNFILTLGHADPDGIYPRNPRPTFEESNRIE